MTSDFLPASHNNVKARAASEQRIGSSRAVTTKLTAEIQASDSRANQFEYAPITRKAVDLSDKSSGRLPRIEELKSLERKGVAVVGFTASWIAKIQNSVASRSYAIKRLVYIRNFVRS